MYLIRHSFKTLVGNKKTSGLYDILGKKPKNITFSELE